MEHAPSFVLIIALGPVQDFIATARRCRDLWFGSWLLSEVSKAASHAISQQAGEDALIFPPPGTDLSSNSNDSVANKIVAVVTGDPRALAQNARDAAQARLQEVAQDVWTQFGFSLGEQNLAFAQAQTGELLEWNWAAAEFAPGDNVANEEDAAFVTARARAERLLAARKSCRDFGEVGDWASPRPKSSLDGARESVIPEAAYRENADQLYERWGVRPGEKLCGVGLLKRHGERGAQGSRIFSTSHVAAQGLLARWDTDFAQESQKTVARNRVADFVLDLHRLGLQNKALGRVPREYEDAIFGEFDGHLLFSNRLAEFFVAPRTGNSAADRENYRAAKNNSDNAVGHLETLLRGLGKARPCPYYAVLLADGDFMGAAITSANNPARNQFLSKQLAGFAASAQTIVSKHRGSLIYAGGDDVLALLPLHSAVDAAKELAIAFRRTFQDPSFDAWLEQRPSLSAGLAIVHHLEPLSGALESARRAEKEAKSVNDERGKKNALAVLLDKRSGGEELVAAHWSSDANPFDGLNGRLDAFARWLSSGAISCSLISDWAELARRFAPPRGRSWSDVEWDAVSEEWELEAVWMTKRKRESGTQNSLTDAVLNDLKLLLQSARAADPRGQWLQGLVNELSIAKEIGIARRIASAPVSIPAPTDEIEENITHA